MVDNGESTGAQESLELLTPAAAEAVEQSYRCICIGPDHFSLAFTDAPLAAMNGAEFRVWIACMNVDAGTRLTVVVGGRVGASDPSPLGAFIVGQAPRRVQLSSFPEFQGAFMVGLAPRRVQL